MLKNKNDISHKNLQIKKYSRKPENTENKNKEAEKKTKNITRNKFKKKIVAEEK